MIVWFSKTIDHFGPFIYFTLHTKSSITVLLYTCTCKFSKVYSNSQTTHQNIVSKVLSSQDKSLFPSLVAAGDACRVVPKQTITNLSIYMQQT